MRKNKVLQKLKKALIVIMVFITIGFSMPTKANADVINSFIDLVMFIPDSVMHWVDRFVAGSHEFTWDTVNLKEGGGKAQIYNFIVTPYEIFSSGAYEVDENGNYKTKLGLLDINFFSDKKITSNTWVSSEMLAPVISNVYKGLESICLVLMMLVLMYIGIKILMSSIAEQQAKYKKLLSDWLVGFALLFIMHYIMSAIVNVNSLVIRMLNDNGEGDNHYVSIAELGQEELLKGPEEWILGTGWEQVAQGTFYPALKGKKFENFKHNRLAVAADGSNHELTFKDYIDSDGKIDFSRADVSALCYGFNGAAEPIDYMSWGDKGVVKLDARIVNAAGPDYDANEEYYDKAILKLNTLSYVRTISSFASTDNENVIFCEDGDMETRADVASTYGFIAMYIFLIIETIVFLITYIKRVIHLAFLTFIAPIVAIMYPLDKVGDGKAQSFNTWFKDYLYNVLIQPFHLLIYIIFIVAAGQLITKNLIYTLAIYAYMIPAEKYMRKILGYEKASNGSGGPMGGLLGTTMALDGLKRMTGIGPGPKGKHPSAGGGKGEGPRKHKLPKVKPGQIAHTTYPGSGGTDSGAPGGAPGANSAGHGVGNGPRGSGSNVGGPNGPRGNGSSGRPSGANQPPPGAGGGKPPANGAIKNTLRSAGHVLGNRFSRAVTGGKYDHLKGHGGAVAAHLGLGAARLLARGAGTIGMGAVGSAVGVATAMATGNVGSIWQGATIGAAAGNRITTNTFDRGVDFFKGISDDISSDRAKYDMDYRANLRRKETMDTLSDELSDMPDEERKKYEKAIYDYAPYTNIKSVDDAKQLMSASNELLQNDEYKDASGNMNEDGLNELLNVTNDAKKWSEIKKNKSKYLAYTEEALTDSIGKSHYESVYGADTWKNLNDTQREAYIASNTDIGDQARSRAMKRYKAVEAAQDV